MAAARIAEVIDSSKSIAVIHTDIFFIFPPVKSPLPPFESKVDLKNDLPLFIILVAWFVILPLFIGREKIIVSNDPAAHPSDRQLFLIVRGIGVRVPHIVSCHDREPLVEWKPEIAEYRIACFILFIVSFLISFGEGIFTGKDDLPVLIAYEGAVVPPIRVCCLIPFAGYSKVCDL